MFNALRNTINKVRTTLLYEHSPYRKPLADLPVSLFPYWQRFAKNEFKGIPSDAFFFAHAAEGLLNFFACVIESGRPCALPSKAADSVWHAWAKVAPAHLKHFCIKHYGRDIPHTEAADMSGGMEEALANCLAAARRLCGRPAAKLDIPRLFALDLKLRMPEGYAYSVVYRQVAFRQMDEHGMARGEAHTPQMLSPARMVEAGLISRDEYDMYVKKAYPDASGCGSGTMHHDSGGACGNGCSGD